MNAFQWSSIRILRCPPALLEGRLGVSQVRTRHLPLGLSLPFCLPSSLLLPPKHQRYLLRSTQWKHKPIFLSAIFMAFGLRVLIISFRRVVWEVNGVAQSCSYTSQTDPCPPDSGRCFIGNGQAPCRCPSLHRLVFMNRSAELWRIPLGESNESR